MSADITPEQLSKIMNEKQNHPVEEKKERTFGQSIDFWQLFRVKGKSGLYYPKTRAHKSGIIPMASFKDFKIVTVRKEFLECLANYVFYKSDGSKIRIGDVFDNLSKHSDEELKSMGILTIMDVAVPNYDQKEFYEYDAQKVLSWYFEIKEKHEWLKSMEADQKNSTE